MMKKALILIFCIMTLAICLFVPYHCTYKSWSGHIRPEPDRFILMWYVPDRIALQGGDIIVGEPNYNKMVHEFIIMASLYAIIYLGLSYKFNKRKERI